MTRKFKTATRRLWRSMIVVGLVLLLLLIIRIYEAERGPELHRWHTWIPHELTVEQLDKAGYADYLNAENHLFDEMKQQVTEKLDADEKTPLNRYFSGSMIYPGHFAQDWNRSYILRPAGTPRGAVVLLHGLTDSPYSLRHIAETYRQQGYVAVAIRLPGHGTVPAGLTDVDWQDWMAATRLAVREATRLAGTRTPLHLVGFSNGGALAVKYALDSLGDATLRRPQQLILLSPMIGVTRFARFAGIAGLPSVFPAFSKTAWLNIVPEFNPFKYNSFPVHAARQTYLLTQALQKEIQHYARNQQLSGFPPVLTFQSVMDSTVSTPSVIRLLYNYLPENGSELVLFDINQAVSVSPLFRHSSYTAVNQLLPAARRHYSSTVITNAAATSLEMVTKSVPAGEIMERIQPLEINYPAGLYSLSHVAIPFPAEDGLYGSAPAKKNEFGISFGTLSLRGESAVLIVGLDSIMRATSNPFYPYMINRIDHHIGCSDKPQLATCLSSF
ncbi:alpha/beta hydrolase [Pantoea sp. Bo_2]|uniref:Alpha/beta hydrolase n=1 Tax=Candidatus Pantoea gossypiicola TaxID=2608008 RepID=A0AB34CD26_9GAMM|nr:MULTISPECIES: alpha/beta hydrolase [Pantoea]KAA5923399.1 alpha/beta hydrolase [Pantoea sp. VH_8]KAA5929142.1 alpha/beta hydrolase [Pantoea sp. VH_4]KAA5942268.1 alpha/beta hydrolase [Pantoea sp. VH_3]KAA5950154.1 alpha/beta hydrolase [Pantoea sp. VH_25]KAA5955855.1 alpha/beta hydrolase [Pantoea sp. VH_16]